MTSSRKRRGRDTERLVAEHVRTLWPHATATAPGASGPDLLHTDGAAIEIKARRSLDLGAWMRQAQRNAHPNAVPVLVIRLDGAGPTTVGSWPAVIPLDALLTLLEQANHPQETP